jgi:hypothetical protein
VSRLGRLYRRLFPYSARDAGVPGLSKGNAMTDTLKALRELFEQQFGPERTAALGDTDKPWHEHIGAKSIDRIDVGYLIQEQFGVTPHAFFFDTASLKEIADMIDAATPNTRPY